MEINFIKQLSYVIALLGITFLLLLISNIVIKSWMKKIDSLVLNEISYNLENITLNNGYSGFIKRLLDIILSFIFILQSLPILFLCSLAIKIENPGPVFVKRKKIGLNGKEFGYLKFRTIKWPIENISDDFVGIKDPRITKVGIFMRRTSIDELPSLINVLIGEMSLVGRSFILDYPNNLIQLTDIEKKHLERIKPGILSLWSVSSNRLTYDVNSMKLFDFYYLKNQSVFLDVQIIFNGFINLLAVSSKY